MNPPVPRVAAIHDLSGFGRASLTVIIPVLFTDLSAQMRDTIEHWRDLDLRFDAVYSGFLGSSNQIDIVCEAIEAFASDERLVLVDPVMGDDGEPYGPVRPDSIEGMRRLIRKAGIITPNFTEACFLLDRPYRKPIRTGELKDWLVQLAELGPSVAIVTSVPLDPGNGRSAVVAYNRADGRFWKVDCTFVPASYPGTGDAFASATLGGLLQFVTLAVKASFGYDLPSREGVLLERVLSNLRAPLASMTYELVEG